MVITGKQSINNTGGQMWAKGYHRTATLESYQGHGDTGPMEVHRQKVNHGQHRTCQGDEGGRNPRTSWAFSSTTEVLELQARHTEAGLGSRSLSLKVK